MFRHLAMASAVCFSTILSAGSGQAQTWDGRYDIVPGAVSTDAGYAARMFDRQDDVTNKTVLALRARQSGALQDYRLYLGGRFLGSVIHESTNTTGKFPILSRLPPTHTLGTSDTYGVVNEASLNATLTLPWEIGRAHV